MCTCSLNADAGSSDATGTPPPQARNAPGDARLQPCGAGTSRGAHDGPVTVQKSLSAGAGADCAVVYVVVCESSRRHCCSNWRDSIRRGIQAPTRLLAALPRLPGYRSLRGVNATHTRLSLHAYAPRVHSAVWGLASTPPSTPRASEKTWRSTPLEFYNGANTNTNTNTRVTCG